MTNVAIRFPASAPPPQSVSERGARSADMMRDSGFAQTLAETRRQEREETVRPAERSSHEDDDRRVDARSKAPREADSSGETREADRARADRLDDEDESVAEEPAADSDPEAEPSDTAARKTQGGNAGNPTAEAGKAGVAAGTNFAGEAGKAAAANNAAGAVEAGTLPGAVQTDAQGAETATALNPNMPQTAVPAGLGVVVATQAVNASAAPENTGLEKSGPKKGASAAGQPDPENPDPDSTSAGASAAVATPIPVTTPLTGLPSGLGGSAPATGEPVSDAQEIAEGQAGAAPMVADMAGTKESGQEATPASGQTGSKGAGPEGGAHKPVDGGAGTAASAAPAGAARLDPAALAALLHQAGNDGADAPVQGGETPQTSSTINGVAGMPSHPAAPLGDVSATASLRPAVPGHNLPAGALAEQVAVHIARHAAPGGANKFEIRLDPPELGRIEVTLEIQRDGQVLAVLAADRPETLELLNREARGLERALQDAGLKTDSGSLSFSLRQDAKGDGNPFRSFSEGGRTGRAGRDDGPIDPEPARIQAAQTRVWRAGGLDIRI